jgi:RNA polymerase sigma factor for flagellar operon FliA
MALACLESAAGVSSTPSYVRAGSRPTRAARNRLILEHLGLVRMLAARLAHRLPPHVESSDLAGVGVLGLIEAAERYRASAGVPFHLFARRRIQGAMLDALRDLDWAPRSLRRLRREREAAIVRLRHALGREPYDREVAGALRLSERAYACLADRLRVLDTVVVSQLESATADDRPLLEVLIDPSEDPAAMLERAEHREHLTRALAELPPRERRILALYYRDELTMAQIGAAIGVSESRVSQLRSLAVSRLRASLTSSGVEAA